MRVINLRDQSPTDIDAVLPRPEMDISAAIKVVGPILEKVKDHGGEALRELSERFDGVAAQNLRVPRQAMRDALVRQPQELTDALSVAIANATKAHRAQLPTEVVSEVVPGGFVYQRWVPLNRVGLYVPGGLAVYPSSVVMNVVAAQVAGVGSLVVASPPQKEFGGLPHPSILAACEMLGVTEVIAVGGSQAIAAMAYGFADKDYVCERVDKVTGPGNIYVAAAKRAVQGVCGIDAEAGTTEIAILADEGANPAFVAADLISQAEHDPAAASVLVTDSLELADAVQNELAVQVEAAPNRDRIRQALEGPQSAVVLTRDIEQATTVIERYGPEHLEVVTKDALERSLSIRNAGAIFVGDYSPVPLGDYVAGSNHVLPTGGTARYSSGLNSTVFLRSIQVIDYDRDALDGLTDSLVTLAKTEKLPSHGTAATIRRESGARGQKPAAQTISLPVREDLREVEPYGAPQLDVPVRLNVNENPYEPSDEVTASITEAVRVASKRLNRYADRDALGLREALADYVSRESGVRVDPAHVWAANGSNEIMLQMLQAFGGPGRSVLVEAPTYSMYEEYARDTFTGFVKVESSNLSFDVDLLIDAMQAERPAVVFIPSPNNPSGTAVSSEDLLRILDVSRQTGPLRHMLLTGSKPPVASNGTAATIVIVDEAYGEFREPGDPSALDLIADNPHLVVTRTMSKAFAAAGLRLGYMVASPEVIREVMKVRLPYHLSLLTQAAAIAALGSADAQLRQVDSIRTGRQVLAEELTAMGLQVLPSSSNFLLFGTFEDRHATWQKLLESGVLIREVGPAGYLRVTVGTEHENRQFLDALKEAL
ncbi:MAG: histidinol-phosphate transaminase [Scrofimicrobium sp.]